MSNTLPCRTAPTPAKPSALSDPWMAWPCGSRTPALRVTVTRAFIGRLLHQPGARCQRIVRLAENAEALGDFAVGIDQPAQILAEAVLVELIARLDVPEPAVVGRDLVGENDPHHVVLVE